MTPGTASAGPDGSVHWIMARGRVLRNVDGTSASMIGVTVDVTTYQLAEEELRRAALLDQAYDAMFAWEWNGPITYWNKGAERHTQGANAEAVAPQPRVAPHHMAMVCHVCCNDSRSTASTRAKRYTRARTDGDWSSSRGIR